MTLIAMLAINTFAEYKTKSVFKDDYRCIAETAGGFNHKANGHALTKFIPDQVFFLTHISNIPKEAILSFLNNSKVSFENIDEDEAREIFEKVLLKQEVLFKDYIKENSGYFIREPDEDPKKWEIYFLNKCASVEMKGYRAISCYENDKEKTFNLDINTGRFTYSYSGSWQSEFKDGYYGDSSVFVFGKCKKYFR